MKWKIEKKFINEIFDKINKHKNNIYKSSTYDFERFSENNIEISLEGDGYSKMITVGSVLKVRLEDDDMINYITGDSSDLFKVHQNLFNRVKRNY